MGWVSGNDIARVLIASAQRNIPDPTRRESLYVDMINALLDQDWDTEDECRGLDPVFDRAIDVALKKVV